MSGIHRHADRFHPAELDGAVPPADEGEVLAAAREVEWLVATDDVGPGAGFTDRVMAAVTAEPTPSPLGAGTSAARRGSVGGVLAAWRDLWRVAWTGGRPLAVRGSALAVVTLVIVGVVGAGAVGAGALAGLVGRGDQTAPPTQIVPASPESRPSPSALPSPVPSALPSPTSSPSPSPSQSADPGEEPSPSEGADPSERAEAEATARPTARPTPRATSTHEPGETHHPDESQHPGETPHE